MVRKRIPSMVAIVAAGLALALGAAAAPMPKVPKLPTGWSHAEINVTIKGVPHTKIYDRGVIAEITGRTLTLDEPDGSVVPIVVAPKAKITLNRKPVKLSRLRVGYTVITIRIDGGPAVGVIATAPKKKTPPQKPVKPEPKKPESAGKPDVPGNSGSTGGGGRGSKS